MALPISVFLLLGLGIVMVAAIIAAFIIYERKRAEKLEAICKELGLRFVAKDDGTLFDALSHFRLFSEGTGRKIRNVFLGQADDREIAIFGYRYTVPHGKNNQTIQQTVMSFRSEQLNLPQFEMRPESFLHKIGKAFGMQDINFEDHPTFSKKYLLRASDEAAVRGVFNDNVLRHFAQNTGVNVEADGNRLIYYRAASRVSPNQIRMFMEEGFRVVGLFQR